MSSIIKVDQIQLADGSTPTASDLGLNTTGSVLQVVDVVRGTEVSLSSTGTWTDTGIYGSITPTSTSSKIYVMFSYSASTWNTSGFGGWSMWRIQRKAPTNTSIGAVKSMYVYDYGGSGPYATMPVHTAVLDSPATTSQCTYELQMLFQSGSACGVNRDASDSTITLIEIAG
jgi:hypothetical protein